MINPNVKHPSIVDPSFHERFANSKSQTEELMQMGALPTKKKRRRDHISISDRCIISENKHL